MASVLAKKSDSMVLSRSTWRERIAMLYSKPSVTTRSKGEAIRPGAMPTFFIRSW